MSDETQDDECRAAFEAWVLSEEHWLSTERDARDRYTDFATLIRWRAWREAWNRRAPEDPIRALGLAVLYAHVERPPTTLGQVTLGRTVVDEGAWRAAVAAAKREETDR